MGDVKLITDIVRSSACPNGRARFERWLEAGDLTLAAYAAMWLDRVVADLIWLLSHLPFDHPLWMAACADTRWQVRWAAVRGLPPEHEARVRLCSDPDTEVREAAVSGLPPEHPERVRLCEDTRWEVREEAVSGLPPEHEARVRLCADTHSRVRKAARGRPHPPTLGVP